MNLLPKSYLPALAPQPYCLLWG